jgi:hypothetical protein
MRVGRLCAALVARRRARPGRVHVTWQTCRRSGSYSFQSADSDRLCGADGWSDRGCSEVPER